MARYRIVRVYEVPANNRYQATDRFMEAIVLGCERDYHQYDVVRPAHDPTGFVKVDLRPATGWWTLVVDQLFGRRARR